MSVVSNPNAGQNTSRAGIGKVISGILAASRDHRNYDTATLEELDNAAEQIHADYPEILAICGGDGTTYQTLTRVLRQYLADPGDEVPQILLIPTGTMLAIASSIGATRYAADELAKRVMYKIENNLPFDIAHANIMRIGDRFGFLYGAGLPVDFLEAYYRGRPNLGIKRGLRVMLDSAMQEAARVLPFGKKKPGFLRSVHAKIRLPDGFDPPVAPQMTHTGIMCATVDQVGMGCRVMFDAMEHPGKFMLRSSSLSYWGLVASLGQLWAGLPAARTFDAVVDRVVIEYEKPTVTMIDGELMEPTLRDEIVCGPLLTFIIG